MHRRWAVSRPRTISALDRKCHYTKELNLENAGLDARPQDADLGPQGPHDVPEIREPPDQHHIRSEAERSSAGRVGPSSLQSLFRDQGPSRDTRAVPCPARPHWQPALLSGDLPRPDGSDRPQCGRRQSGARARALGYAGTHAVRRRSGHKHPQRLKPALARLVLAEENRCIVPATAFSEYADAKLRRRLSAARSRPGPKRRPR
jgi:hypothetical protein